MNQVQGFEPGLSLNLEPTMPQVKLLGRCRRLNDALKLASDYQKEVVAAA